MTGYGEFTYSYATFNFLVELSVGEEKVWEVECPRRGRMLPNRYARASISNVSRDMGIVVSTRYEKDEDIMTVRRIK